ncbi:hypothetical protein VIGAN_01379000 [Vigna angularis var. angularis]|uniref:Uncharacterized protein n=1 Tax=Vigna angularis var. angularis TaxID=157739 RepID=A0A0S3R5J1_PHAAN|nr:hypothetical protein VIGAN_01379000 [Vigna angularis var. angularis]
MSISTAQKNPKSRHAFITNLESRRILKPQPFQSLRVACIQTCNQDNTKDPEKAQNQNPKSRSSIRISIRPEPRLQAPSKNTKRAKGRCISSQIVENVAYAMVKTSQGKMVARDFFAMEESDVCSSHQQLKKVVAFPFYLYECVSLCIEIYFAVEVGGYQRLAAAASGTILGWFLVAVEEVGEEVATWNY